jgi:hypothetical protein
MAINYKFPPLHIIFYDAMITKYNKRQTFMDEIKFTLNLTVIF